MKRPLRIAAALLVLALWAYAQQRRAVSTEPVAPSATQAPEPASQVPVPDASAAIADAFRTQRSDLQVQGLGVVDRVLADDNDGSRHQRFILRLASRQTILVAHNIDLAPRLAGLQRGDTVRFFGEYEWNANGGVIHWTHHDPDRRHVGGWLEHRGRRVE